MISQELMERPASEILISARANNCRYLTDCRHVNSDPAAHCGDRYKSQSCPWHQLRAFDEVTGIGGVL